MTQVQTQAKPAAAAPVALKIPPQTIAAIAVVAVGFIWVFWRWFERQHQHSFNKLDDWGHAYIIPVISVWLIYQRREILATLKARTFWPGLAPFLLGLMCYFFAVVGIKNHMVEGFSMVLTLYGLLLLLLGPAVMRYLFLPVVFLLFAVTISESIMITVTSKLQLIASEGSFVMLAIIGKIFNFSVDLEGVTLTVVTASGEIHPLNVAEACSGMRMVVAFYALAVAVALVSCKQWWQRIATMLLAGPVAVFMNMIRVTVLGVLTLIDPDLAAGNAHTMIGTILLIPSLLLFLGVVWALNRVVQEPEGATA